MTTTTDAIEHMIEITGQPAGSVRLIARHLRDDPDGDLWPKGRKGGGRFAAHVGPDHLANLLLGILAADIIAGAPAVVRRLRAFEPTRVTEFKGIVPTPDITDLRPAGAYDQSIDSADLKWLGPTLGEAIDNIIRHSSNNMTKNIISDLKPSVFLYRRHAFEIVTIRCGHIEKAFTSVDLFSNHQSPSPCAVTFTAAAPFDLLAAMIGLLNP